VRLRLPFTLRPDTVISDVQVSAAFAEGNPAHPASRSVQMLLNGVPVGDGNVPEQSHLSFPADAGLIMAGWQTIGLRAVNQNSAHYNIADNFTLQMNVSYTGSVCASQTAGVQLMSVEDQSCQVEQTPEPFLTPTPGGSTSTPVPVTCTGTVTDGVNLRAAPEIGDNILTQITIGENITIIGRTEGAPIERWYLIAEEGTRPQGWVTGQYVNEPCDNVTLYVGTDLFTATPTHTPTATYTATYGPSPTPTPTPTAVPRDDIPQEAEPIQDDGFVRSLGLPLPFNRFVVQGGMSAVNSMQGYGPTTFGIADQQYEGTHGVHTGVDYFGDVNVVALCDGVIIAGRNATNGGSTNVGRGLSLRCFANDPPDPDGNGIRNLSNLVVSYNHLAANLSYTPGQYQIVIAGTPLGETTHYNVCRIAEEVEEGTPTPAPLTCNRSNYNIDCDGGGCKPIIDHLHLEMFIARGFELNAAIHFNPLLMFATGPAELQLSPIGDFPYFPEDFIGDTRGVPETAIDVWTQQGNLPDTDPGSNSFYGIQMTATPGVEWRAPAWSEDRLIPQSILIQLMRDYYGYEGPNLYVGPECSNVIIGEAYPESCELINNDSALSAPSQ
jgi:hypothetical protein